jgi:hypothetical protein
VATGVERCTSRRPTERRSSAERAAGPAWASMSPNTNAARKATPQQKANSTSLTREKGVQGQGAWTRPCRRAWAWSSLTRPVISHSNRDTRSREPTPAQEGAWRRAPEPCWSSGDHSIVAVSPERPGHPACWRIDTEKQIDNCSSWIAVAVGRSLHGAPIELPVYGMLSPSCRWYTIFKSEPRRIVKSRPALRSDGENRVETVCRATRPAGGKRPRRLEK